MTTTNILWNGSKYTGEGPNPIEDLYDALGKYTLSPSLAPHCVPSPLDQSLTHYFGNFIEFSHGFALDTNDPEVIERLNALITENVSSGVYRVAAAEHSDRIANKTALPFKGRW